MVCVSRRWQHKIRPCRAFVCVHWLHVTSGRPVWAGFNFKEFVGPSEFLAFSVPNTDTGNVTHWHFALYESVCYSQWIYYIRLSHGSKSPGCEHVKSACQDGENCVSKSPNYSSSKASASQAQRCVQDTGVAKGTKGRLTSLVLWGWLTEDVGPEWTTISVPFVKLALRNGILGNTIMKKFPALMCKENPDCHLPKSVYWNNHMQSTGRIVKHIANIYFKIMFHSEAAPSRFDPGNRLPWDVRIFCKSSYKFIYIYIYI